MPRLSPDAPEQVTYHQYEADRDDGLPPASLQVKQQYTVRLRVKQPTAELYAFDISSRVELIKHLGGFSVVRFNAQFETKAALIEVGVNLQGISFNHNAYSGDPDEIPYKNELGYFVGERGLGSDDRALLESGSLSEVLSLEQGRELVISR